MQSRCPSERICPVERVDSATGSFAHQSNSIAADDTGSLRQLPVGQCFEWTAAKKYLVPRELAAPDDEENPLLETFSKKTLTKIEEVAG